MEKVASDVKLTFDNAIHYNPPGQEIHKVRCRGHVLRESIGGLSD
jgi:hypothetical protein